MYQAVFLMALTGGSIGNPPAAEGCQAVPVVYYPSSHVGFFERLRAHFPSHGCHGGLFSGGLFRHGHGAAATPGCSTAVVTPSAPPAPAAAPLPAPANKLPAGTTAPATPPAPAPAPAPKVGLHEADRSFTAGFAQPALRIDAAAPRKSD